ncbi:YbdK family carboxylate-amine ligase [Streptomyces sp. NPDC090445]|uniref:carboxylate-amine ligase n=1 Tax=Streptomyces sp. NPDC090445 TaxID=3365963 RepID=UPI0037FE9F4C
MSITARALQTPPVGRRPTGPLTVGVEEEFLLVDRGTRAPAGRAPAVLADARQILGERAQSEFFTVQVETCTVPATRLTDLYADLARSRRVMNEAAAASGCLLVATGTPPIAPPGPLTVTEGERYRRISERYAQLLADELPVMCGCHVHVGVDSRGQALALANHMGPWLPVLAALAANSPYLDGHDTGYAARRAVDQGKWPTTGPAPLVDEAGYEHTVSDLVRRGVLLDRRMLYWYARPSEHVPTLEIRVADSNADLDTVVLLAALVRGLAATCLHRIDAGLPAPRPAAARLRRAYESAARYGLSSPDRTPTGPGWAGRTGLGRLLAFAGPALAAHGDLAWCTQAAARLLAAGTGADRQRRAYRAGGGDLTTVVDDLAATTAAACG